MVHKFTNEEISRIKEDFKEFIIGLESDLDLTIMLAFTDGYIRSLEISYGEPIEDIKFITDLRNTIEEYFKFFSDNPSLYDMPIQEEMAKNTFEKVRKIIIEGIIEHKFTNEEISRIKEDFRKIMKDLEESINLISAIPVLVAYTNGYMTGLKKAYGMPIEEIDFIIDLRNIAMEQIMLYKEDPDIYVSMSDNIARDLWNRIKNIID